MKTPPETSPTREGTRSYARVRYYYALGERIAIVYVKISFFLELLKMITNYLDSVIYGTSKKNLLTNKIKAAREATLFASTAL